MPTTLTGLLLFVVLLVPGFTYVTGKDRNCIGQKPTPFRETAAVITASVSSELAVLVIFTAIRTISPAQTPDVGALIRDSSSYLRGTEGHAGHYGQVALWAVGMLAFSTVLAYLATLPQTRKLAAKALGPYPHLSTVSGWWLVFETWKEGRDIHLGCVLDDKSYVDGWLGSFSLEADDTPDRDLILTEPIRYRPPGADRAEPYEVGAVCISAARIVALFVNYSVTEPVRSLEAAEAAVQVSIAVQAAAASAHPAQGAASS